jgi:hypothetical protein
MKTVKRVIYITDDETEFLTEEEAKAYEKRKELEMIFDDHIIYTDTLCDFSGLIDKLLDWKPK